jgi:hypothetical protein
MEEIKNNTSKYNYGEPIPLDLIPNEDLETALEDFSRGSIGLSKCLRVMWMYGLKTHSCNPGNRNSFDIGHITMEEGEDVFSYLSEAFLNDERIRIDLVENKQQIKFAGNAPEKEGALLFLTRDIQSGRKKKTQDLIAEKIGESFPDSWVRRLKTHTDNINSTYWSERVLIKKKETK